MDPCDLQAPYLYGHHPIIVQLHCFASLSDIHAKPTCMPENNSGNHSAAQAHVCGLVHFFHWRAGSAVACISKGARPAFLLVSIGARIAFCSCPPADIPIKLQANHLLLMYMNCWS